MSAKTDTIVRNLLESIKNVGTEKTSAFDSVATVRRIEGNTAWVHFEGGAEETPAKLTINAKIGDQVQVRVSNGVAFLVGNGTAPPTDDTAAILAQNAANQAVESANIAFRAASTAVEDAATANEAANTALGAATQAQNAADQAIEDAATASSAASAAQTSANQAILDAATAQASASAAQTAASNAQTSANTANAAANNALTQLSVVEDVVGTLNWISQHGTYAASTDTEVVPGKYYFTRSGSGTEADPYVYTVVVNPTGNPSTNNYYELDSIDEAVSNYISTHLALTDEGLWVLKDNVGYKVLITNDSFEVYDSLGEKVADFGEVVDIGTDLIGRLRLSSSAIEMIESHEFPILDIHKTGIVVQREMFDYAENEVCTFSRQAITGDTFDVWVANTAKTSSVREQFTVGNSETKSSPSSRYYGTLTYDADARTVTYVTSDSSQDMHLYYIKYITPIDEVYYSLGSRYGSGVAEIGSRSVVIGDWNMASGESSVAIGANCRSAGSYSFAIGNQANATGSNSYAIGHGAGAFGNSSYALGDGVTASGDHSIAEGQNTIAQGDYSRSDGYNSQSRGDFSYAGGYENYAYGDYSYARGCGNNADGDYQTVIGKYNGPYDVQNDDVAFVIGNGEATNKRSNAFLVMFDGNMEVELDTSAASGSVDGDLYAAITALGWENEVIV